MAAMNPMSNKKLFFTSLPGSVVISADVISADVISALTSFPLNLVARLTARDSAQHSVPGPKNTLPAKPGT